MRIQRGDERPRQPQHALRNRDDCAAKELHGSRRGGERRAREDADARRRLARTTITTGGPVFREDGGRGKGDGGERGETVIQGERP